MALPSSPFAPSTLTAGQGSIHLSLHPPNKQTLTSLSFQYPLKLISPDPHYITSPSRDDSPQTHQQQQITTVFLLTYGGGLVNGDAITLTIELDAHTRLALVTQGSTKLFKSPSRHIISRQSLDVKISSGAALCYLPDPTQPFADSVYEQRQTFYVDPDGPSSLLMLDWVTQGRAAKGEKWDLWSWRGRNEVRYHNDTRKGQLLLRDAVVLSDERLGGMGLVDKTNGMGVFGTLIIYGPVFRRLGEEFMRLFGKQPRIGAKNFERKEDEKKGVEHVEDAAMKAEKLYEDMEGFLWTAANVRGFVLVKFGARDVDGARRWLGGLLRLEGSVERHFGHQALIGLR